MISILRSWGVSILSIALIVAALPNQAAQKADTAQSLDAKIATVLPRPQEERWLTIPWRTNLMQARLEAQNLNRPIFLWIMNGHPMGCT